MKNRVTSFLSRGFLLKEVNKTLFCLIPKNPGAAHFHDFLPISLCNVSYKIISKMLTNRLKEILPDLILPYQSSIIKGRSITDNILIANEIVFKFQKSKTKGNIGFNY